jgi:hypothetical protein
MNDVILNKKKIKMFKGEYSRKVVGLALIGLLFLPTVYAQETTFDDCYSDMTNNLYILSISTDPEIKQFLTNYCNFAYEKTGMWITNDNHGLDKLSQSDNIQFLQTNGVPESLTDLIRSMVLANLTYPNP